MQRRQLNGPDGAEEPEIPILRGVIPIFPVPPPIRPPNIPGARNMRRLSRNRADSPDTAIEYDQNEVDALKRMKEIANRQISGSALIERAKQETSFSVINDNVRAVREAEERHLMKELDAHLQSIQEGNVNRAAILMLMTPLCNYLERIEAELTNALLSLHEAKSFAYSPIPKRCAIPSIAFSIVETRNLLTDIEIRLGDLIHEIRHVEQMAGILQKNERRDDDHS